MMDLKQTILMRAVLTSAHHDYSKGLKSHAFFKTQNYEMSEDLTQDAFTKTWKYLVRGGKIDLMKAFLYHILNDLIIDEYRKRKPVSLDFLLEKGFQPSAGKPERLFNILDGKNAVLLIARLPEKYQKIIKMRYLQDLSLKEMSLLTGQTKNNLTVQVHRGLEKLKNIYDRI